MSTTTDSGPRLNGSSRRAGLTGLVRLVLILSATAGALWYLDSGGSLPVVGTLKHRSPDRIDVSGFGASQSAAFGAESGPGPKIGDPAPGFSLQAIDGKPVNLSDFSGQTVLLNFWASWCGPCRADLPELQSAYDRLRARGLAVVGVNVEERPATARRFAEDLGVSYPLVLDRDGGVTKRYRVSGLPLTIVVGPDGVIRGQIIGQLDSETISRSLSLAGFRLPDPPH